MLTIIVKNGMPVTVNEDGEELALTPTDLVQLLKSEIVMQNRHLEALNHRLLYVLNTIVRPAVSPEVWQELKDGLGL